VPPLNVILKSKEGLVKITKGSVQAYTSMRQLLIESKIFFDILSKAHWAVFDDFFFRGRYPGRSQTRVAGIEIQLLTTHSCKKGCFTQKSMMRKAVSSFEII